MSQNVELTTKTENPNIPNVFDVMPEDVINNKENLILVDVRTLDEYHGELGHIQGSSLIVLDDLPEKVDSLPKDKTIVFICRSGNRSAQASYLAHSKGFQNTYNLAGGMMLWNEQGLEIEQ
jgi:rhodanese-related sulfurtransferase